MTMVSPENQRWDGAKGQPFEGDFKGWQILVFDSGFGFRLCLREVWP
jgi:hypothetical protein